MSDQSAKNISTFAEIIKQGLIKNSAEADCWATNKYFIVDLLTEKIKNIHVDEDWYLSNHEDVQASV